MFDNILTVCDGNICRSPTAAFLLARETGKHVESAGLVGLTDHDMDATAKDVAIENGLDCPAHSARKLTSDICRQFDLILVMETRQKERLISQFPQASGKVMLLGHWLKQEVPDPYRKSREVYEYTYRLIQESVASWKPKLT